MGIMARRRMKDARKKRELAAKQKEKALNEEIAPKIIPPKEDKKKGK